MTNQTKLYVGNLPYSTTTEDLQQLFAEFGNITDAVVIIDRASGRSRGFGFVEFDSNQAADTAVKKMAGYDLNGRRLVVNIARERSSSRNFRR